MRSFNKYNHEVEFKNDDNCQNNEHNAIEGFGDDDSFPPELPTLTREFSYYPGRGSPILFSSSDEDVEPYITYNNIITIIQKPVYYPLSKNTTFDITHTPIIEVKHIIDRLLFDNNIKFNYKKEIALWDLYDLYINIRVWKVDDYFSVEFHCFGDNRILNIQLFNRFKEAIIHPPHPSSNLLIDEVKHSSLQSLYTS